MSRLPEEKINLSATHVPELKRSYLSGIWLLIALVIGVVVAQLQNVNIALPLFALGLLVIFVLGINPWRGAIILLLASQFSILKFDYGAYTVRPEQLLLLVFLACFFICFLLGKVRIYSTVLDIPIIGLLAIGFLSSTLYSPDYASSIRGLYLQIIYVSMYFFIVNALLNNAPKIDKFVKLLLVSAVLHGVYALTALASFFAGFDIGGISAAHYNIMAFPSASGLFQEANLFGAFSAVMAIVLATHLVTKHGTRITKSPYLVAGVLILFSGMIVSMTRAAWIGAVFAMVALLFYSRPKFNVINPRTLAFIGISLIAFVLIIFPLVDYIFSGASGTSNALLGRMLDVVNFESGSGAGRLRVQEAALEEWSAHPIVGTGILSLRVEGAAAGAWLYSTMIQSLHDTGLIGGFFMLLIHLLPVCYGLWAATKTTDNTRKASLVGLSLGAIVLAIGSQASSFLWLGFPWIYYGILVALAKITLLEAKNEETSILHGDDTCPL